MLSGVIKGISGESSFVAVIAALALKSPRLGGGFLIAWGGGEIIRPQLHQRYLPLKISDVA